MPTDDTHAVPESTVVEVCGEVDLPRMGLIGQAWDTDPIPADRVRDRAAAAVDALDFEAVPDGGEVAVGVGSRGIANLPEIVGGVVDGVRDDGYEAFAFPAMGSHGGATAAGQREMLAALGVTEDAVGCEIRATMDAVEVGTTPDRGVPAYAGAEAVAADAILPVNRVKPHTAFDGSVESGLAKMLVIGTGKQRGAKTAHEWAVDWSFRNMIPEIARTLLDALPVVGGVAVVEDQRDDTAVIEGVPASRLLDREAELLDTAYDLLPTLPFDDVDLLVVDRIGKDVSGTGMDPNVTGRRPYGPEPEPERPAVDRIYVRSLTPASHGNANGLAAADLAHADAAAARDPETTLVNTLTSSKPRGAGLPPVVETDRAGVVAGHSAVGGADPDTARVLRITDTMRLERVAASEALVEEAGARDDLRVVADPEPIDFEDGALAAPSPTPVDR